MYDQGSHAWAWQPDGQRPVSWMGANSIFEEGQPIRGGIPVVFPWFGTRVGANQRADLLAVAKETVRCWVVNAEVELEGGRVGCSPTDFS